MLKQRIITALVLLPLVVWLNFFAASQWFVWILGLIIIMAAWEWSRFAGFEKPAARIACCLVMFAMLLTVAKFLPTGVIQLLIAGAASGWFVIAALIVFIQRRANEPSVPRSFSLLSGVIVLVSAWLALVQLHDEGSHMGRTLVMLLLLMIWAADIAAYFAGRQWGRTPLAERVSPKKTREGALAGIMAATLVAMGYAILWGLQGGDIIIFLLISLMTAMISIIGDLFESLLKRSARLKDSGGLLPGHGGVMDRIDSLTAAGPVFYSGLWLSGLAG